MSKLKVTKTSLEGVLIIEPQCFEDGRGYFMESYSKKDLEEIGITNDFVQENHTFNQSIHTFRGLHFQNGNFAQARLKRVITGSILDVVVDIRKNSPTYGKWESFVLSAENKKQLFAPVGFAHGMLSLEENTHFVFKCDNYYDYDHFTGIRPNDLDLAIDWGIDIHHVISTKKDFELPTLIEYEFTNDFYYEELKS